MTKAESLKSINIDDTREVSVRANFDFLKSNDGQELHYFRWSSRRNVYARRFVASESEQDEVVLRRNIIDKVVSLSPQFTGRTHHNMADESIRSARNWLDALHYDDLAIATASLGRQFRERRLADCTKQVSRLNELIAEDSDLHILLIPQIVNGPEEPNYRVAKLKGMFIKTNEVSEPFPGLIIADNSGSVGPVPEEYNPFGLYVKAS